MEIDLNKFYTVQDVAEIISITPQTVRNKCNTWEMICSNISSKSWRAIYRIKGENILNFLSK